MGLENEVDNSAKGLKHVWHITINSASSGNNDYLLNLLMFLTCALFDFGQPMRPMAYTNTFETSWGSSEAKCPNSQGQRTKLRLSWPVN